MDVQNNIHNCNRCDSFQLVKKGDGDSLVSSIKIGLAIKLKIALGLFNRHSINELLPKSWSIRP